jgi:phage terminase large subunit
VILRSQTPAVFRPLWESDRRYLGAWGGRGSGKSWDRALHAVVRMEREPARVACVREVQKSLKDSVHQLMVDTIQRENLGARFDITENKIQNIVTGGFAVFLGMKDQNAESIKSLEGFDVAWWEEAQNASERSMRLLRPTIRKPRSQLWFTWNPAKKSDPVDKLMRQSGAAEAERTVVKANWDANIYFTEELERERRIALSEDPKQYAHIWEGAYEDESDTQFISAGVVQMARKREPISQIDDPMVLGVDVARYGDDSTCLQPRKGNDAQTYPHERLRGFDTMQVVGRISEMHARLNFDMIFIDETGVGAGVVDRCRQLMLPVMGINFGAAADVPVQGIPKCANKRAEIWAKAREAMRRGLAIADDDELEMDATAPTYRFDANNAILLEKKEDMKKRGVRSPDRFDALALTYAYPVVPRSIEEILAAQADEEYDPIFSRR